jgi:hypothetical protein
VIIGAMMEKVSCREALFFAAGCWPLVFAWAWLVVSRACAPLLAAVGSSGRFPFRRRVRTARDAACSFGG